MMKTSLIIAAALGFGMTGPAAAQDMDHNMHGGHVGHGQEQLGHGHHHGHQMGTGDGSHAARTPPHDHGSSASSGHQGDGEHDHHGGHDMPSHGGAASADPPERPVDPAALSGPAHAADLYYAPSEMAEVRDDIMREHGDMLVTKLLLDRFEATIGDGADGYAWEADAWIGKDIDKFWIKSEGEGAFGETVEHAEVQALWSHALDPWFDLQMGVRQDFQPHSERTHAVLAIQGLAPYWFEVSGEVFLSHKGDVTARAEAEYDLRLAGRLILQPRLELNLSAQKVREIGLGDGLTGASLGARLRYEFSPQFAPYIGAQWEESFGATRRYARAEGEDPSRVALVLGMRFWF